MHGGSLQWLFLKGVPVSIPARELLKKQSPSEVCHLLHRDVLHDCAAAGALSFTRRIMSVDAYKWKGNLWPKNNVTKVPHIRLPVLADSINLLGIVKPLSNPLLRI